jgi:hypothetical protein
MIVLRYRRDILQEATMAGGTKPARGTRKAEAFKDGLRKGGGVGKKKHAGPKRASVTPPSRAKGDINTAQQGNRANVRQNTTRQGNRRSA